MRRTNPHSSGVWARRTISAAALPMLLAAVLAATAGYGTAFATTIARMQTVRVRNANLRADAVRTVRLLTDDGELVLTMEEYLRGVVPAEMPASFPEEALKAQTVAARTFAIRTMRAGRHGGAVCADSACCQAWLSAEQLEARYGTAYQAAEEKVHRAIRQTDGVVATCDGELIEAVYFSSSGGRTEDARAVWGGEVAYLRSVESPGEETAETVDVVEVPLEAFREKLLSCAPEAELSCAPADWLGAVAYSAGGGVETVEIGGVAWSGTQLRALFGLRSTLFTVTVGETGAVFRTRGYGHRVGMSQYGARAMAEAGATYDRILQHYYTGIQLKTLVK